MSRRAKLRRLRRQVRILTSRVEGLDYQLRQAAGGTIKSLVGLLTRLDRLECEVMVCDTSGTYPTPHTSEPTPPNVKRKPWSWESGADLAYERGRIFATKDVASAVAPEEPHLAYLLGFNEALIEQEERWEELRP